MQKNKNEQTQDATLKYFSKNLFKNDSWFFFFFMKTEHFFFFFLVSNIVFLLKEGEGN